MAKKVDFLIIGFTGPISSGCTTLAKIISRLKPNGLLKRMNLYEKACNNIKSLSISMKSELNEQRLRDLNNELQRYYQMREYLGEIQMFEDPNFTYISMSTLIIMIALKFIETNEFKEWDKSNVEIGKILVDFRDKWKETFSLFEYISESKFDTINEEDLRKIDQMLINLEMIKEEIKKKELKLYFEEKIEEFHLQSFGDNIRRSGNPFNFSDNVSQDNIAQNIVVIPHEVNRLIKFYRNRVDDKKSCCFIIDAFRNPIEVEYFRKRYSQFFLVSLYASHTIRFNRLRKIFSELDSTAFARLFNDLDERDLGQDEDVNLLFKQKVSHCSYLSDIAINNENETVEFDNNLFEKFLKYYALMVSPGCVQPSKEEMFMNLAYTLSLRSTCISRKVGAVITDEDGYLLGMGWNDVAHTQVGCGLRIKEDLVKYCDERYSIELIRYLINDDDLDGIETADSFCFKDVLSLNKIKNKLRKAGLDEKTKDYLLNLLKIKRLEYCRSLHAEENALLQVSARGGRGVNNGTIYTTTFPCELCAKKIYQSGIKRIFYTEPYPNSISENVFLKDGIKKITIQQFEGVKSFSYFKLFKPHLDRKEAQYLSESYYKLF